MMQPLNLQQLSPNQAKLCLEVKKFWYQHLIPSTNRQEKKVLLAISGGADSTAMAVILYLLQKQLGISLCAVTVNHKLRDSAECDVLFVKKLCEKLGVSIYCREADVPKFAKKNKLGMEEAARTLRYDILEEMRDQTASDYIAVAHNADDLCEDTLMRLCRGTGWPGLGGMSAIDKQRKVVRPLLQIPRVKIETFLTSLNITWQTDETNCSQLYTRNRFRQTIAPQFHRENPNFHKAIQKLWNIAILDAQFWEDYLNKALENIPWQKTNNENFREICLGKKLLDALPKAARLRLLVKAIKDVKVNKNNIKSDVIFSLEKTWAKGQGGKEFELTKELTVKIKNRNIYIRYKHSSAK